MVKLTLIVFNKVRKQILRLLRVFNNSKSMLDLITNREYIYFEEHYDDSLDAYEISVYDALKRETEFLINSNNISNLLPNSVIQNINLFWKMFVELKDLECKK